jgi:hypothetical protein
MTELTEKLRRGVQEYGNGYARGWNVSMADSAMDDAADLIDSQERLIAEMVKWLEYLPKPYPDDAEMVMDLVKRASPPQPSTTTSQ